jgi:hypothetical protein
MRKGDRVTYGGKPAVLASIRLDQVGDVDKQGHGILRPAMVADVQITDERGKVVRRVKGVPLSNLHQIAN